MCEEAMNNAQSPLQEAISIVTIVAVLVAVACYLAAINNVPIVSAALFLIASQAYQWAPALTRLPGAQVPMLVSAALVGGTIYIIGLAFASSLAAWFSAGQLRRLEQQTRKLKRNRARIRKHRRDRDRFDVT